MDWARQTLTQGLYDCHDLIGLLALLTGHAQGQSHDHRLRVMLRHQVCDRVKILCQRPSFDKCQPLSSDAERIAQRYTDTTRPDIQA